MTKVIALCNWFLEKKKYISKRSSIILEANPATFMFQYKQWYGLTNKQLRQAKHCLTLCCKHDHPHSQPYRLIQSKESRAFRPSYEATLKVFNMTTSGLQTFIPIRYLRGTGWKLSASLTRWKKCSPAEDFPFLASFRVMPALYGERDLDDDLGKVLGKNDQLFFSFFWFRSTTCSWSSWTGGVQPAESVTVEHSYGEVANWYWRVLKTSWVKMILEVA